MKQCFPFRVLGGSPASARKRWVSGFFCQKLHQKTFGWWLMVRYRFFFCGLVFFWCLVVENQNVKSFCIYIYDILTNIGCPIAVSWWSLFAIFFEYLEEGFWWQLFFLVARRPWRRRRLKGQIRRCLFETHIFVMDDDSLWLIWLVYSDLWWCYQWLPDWSDWICSLLFAEFPSVSI